MDWTQVIDALQQALITILIAGISAVAVIAVIYINKLKEKAIASAQSIKDESARKLVTDAINRLSDFACTAVTSLEQESVKEIKEGIADGKYTREDLCALRDVAVQTVMNQITPQAMELIKTEITDVESYVQDLVSRYVYELKNNNGIPIMLEGIAENCNTVE